MDECLAQSAVDISGRPFLYFDGLLSGNPFVSLLENGIQKEFQTDVLEDFWQSFTNALGCNLHLEVIRGRSDHHKIEALFKAAARSLRIACEYDDRARDIIPSTKGSLPGFDNPRVVV
jgi:imidazoleglycerol-phosphate dehydratase